MPGIDWEKVKKMTEKGKFPPFLRLEGKQGNAEIILTAPLRMVKGKYGERLTATVLYNGELYTWTLPSRVIDALTIDKLKEIDEKHTIYIVKIAWLGEGRTRRYEVLEVVDINELPKKEQDKIGKTIVEKIKQYDTLVELLSWNQKEEKKEEETNYIDILQKIKMVLDFAKKIPLSEETLSKLGISRELIKELWERKLIKLDKKGEHIIGVNID